MRKTLLVLALAGVLVAAPTSRPSLTALHKRRRELEAEIAKLRRELADVNREIAALEAGTAKEIDLIAKEATRDTVSGQWLLTEHGLLSRGDARARMQLQAPPTRAYRLRVSLACEDKTSSATIMLPVGGSAVVLYMTPTGFGLGRIDGRLFSDTPTFTRRVRLVPKVTYPVEVTVSPRGAECDIRVAVRGREMIQWTGKASRLTAVSAWAMPNPKRIGLGANRGGVVFRKATVSAPAK